MANTLTNLIPDVYAALDVVSRELVGFTSAVTIDASANQIGENQNLRIPVAPAASASDITPAMSLPSAADETIGYKTLTLSKQRKVAFSWSGEEQHSVNKGPGYQNLRQAQIGQRIRTLTNEMEADLASALRKAASRAYGTAGTTPFASSLVDSAQALKILLDNGAPTSDLQMVLNTTAGAALRTLLNNPLNANPAMSNNGLADQGVILNNGGFAIRESGQLSTVTKGTGASYVLNGAHAAGATSITVKTGTGTILAGDVITINSVKYVVTTGIAAAGTLVIAAPGLLAAGADGDTVTVGNNFTPSVAFARTAGLLATRLPMAPAEGDLARVREVITDPRSGISFELAVYQGYRKVTCEIAACWGVLAVKPEHIALVLG
jgi:hypothetical protein